MSSEEGNIAMDDRAVMRTLQDDDNIKKWVCQFCRVSFPYDVHPETIRHHLTWNCERAPENVKEAAQRREVEAAECSRSVEGNGSNFNAQTEYSRNAGREVEAAECSRSINWEPTRTLDASEDNDGNFEAEIESNIVHRSNKRQRSTPDALPIVAEGIFNGTEIESNIVHRSNKRQRTTLDELPVVAALEVPLVDMGESASLTKRLVGDAFKINEEKIWSLLMDDQVLRIGIYGMGGVGKTTLMRHIQTRLKGERSSQVYWITVSQDFSIWKLQNLIAKKIGLSFSDEEDEVDRAGELTLSLKAKGKCVLILDDLWNDFDLDEVGIPVGVNLCKLVLTTRLFQVCPQMDCSEANRIQLQALSQEEAWILFTRELGNYSTEVEELAQAICRECAGLPLGVKVMARSMKGICNDHAWKSTLVELKESKVSTGKMQEQVFSVLKFSYLQLKDPALQECLSYCALFPEDEAIDRNDLIEYMIVEGIIDAKKNRGEELNKGHTMLNRLENACLLEGDTSRVWMHDLIRDMVILELRGEGSKTLVEAGAQLKELPDLEKWTESLVRVSLVSNDIEVIPSDYSPRCPNLSTLLLCGNYELQKIPNSFFEQFQCLKILDISGCFDIDELPKSTSELVNLRALLLCDCTSLIYVPSLAKLQKLEKLDLNGCEKLKQMPEGVRFLLKLKYLDLSGSGMEKIRSGTISKLSQLQVLKLCYKHGHSNFSIEGSEVVELTLLETLRCVFNTVGEAGEYMKCFSSQQSPTDFSVFVGRHPILNINQPFRSRKNVSILGGDFISPLVLPTDIEAVRIKDCRSTVYERLFPPSLLASLLNLQEIHVYKWSAIEEIFAMNEGKNGEGSAFTFSNYSTPSDSSRSLLNLKEIVIRECHKLKKLFPPTLLPNLHNLQEIWVQSCDGMEELFSTDQEEEKDRQGLSFDQSNLPELNLSRLTTLRLRYLPELRSIYKGTIICHSLQQIQLVKCPKLKRITVHLPQLSLQDILVYPREWWDSVQWGSANDKNHLESLCVFEEFFPIR